MISLNAYAFSPESGFGDALLLPESSDFRSDGEAPQMTRVVLATAETPRIVTVTAPPSPPAVQEPPPEARYGIQCLAEAREAERNYHIPAGMVVAMSLVESGLGGEPRMSAGGAGTGYVGCMQLSLTQHGTKFSPPREIYNSRAHVDFAARYLRAHYDALGSWSQALARYNGSQVVNASRFGGYVCKVQAAMEALDLAQPLRLVAKECAPRPFVSERLKEAFAVSLRRPAVLEELAELPEPRGVSRPID